MFYRQAKKSEIIREYRNDLCSFGVLSILDIYKVYLLVILSINTILWSKLFSRENNFEIVNQKSLNENIPKVKAAV